MKFEFATVEVKKFDLEDVLTISSNPNDCPENTALPCLSD